MTKEQLIIEYKNLIKKYLSSEYGSDDYKSFHHNEPILYRKLISLNVDRKKIFSLLKEAEEELFL
jgi:hypothetical protein